MHGLVTIAMRAPQDTMDPRQSDHTHTAVCVASDTWQIADRQQLQFSEYFRTYSLDLRSDFGDGLIRQSEFRTVTGGNTSYNRRVKLGHLIRGGPGFPSRFSAERRTCS